MYYKSFLEMAQEELTLCEEIRWNINILSAAQQVEDEGTDTGAHAKLLSSAGEAVARSLPKLRKIRGEMGGRLMLMEEIAAAALRERLNEPGGDGR